MGQTPRKILAARQNFDLRDRETIRAKLAALKFECGGRGNDWLGNRIAESLPRGSIKNQASFNRSLRRFMNNEGWTDNRFVGRIAEFAMSLPYHATPALSMRVFSVYGGYLFARNFLFHFLPFPLRLSWFEWVVDSSEIVFVFEEGRTRIRGYVRDTHFEILRESDYIRRNQHIRIDGVDYKETELLELRKFKNEPIEGVVIIPPDPPREKFKDPWSGEWKEAPKWW